MLDLGLIDAAALIAKDALKQKIDERNERALSEKAKRIQVLSQDKVAQLVLSDNEAYRGNISMSASDAYDSLCDHLKSTQSWAEYIDFRDLPEQKFISRVFIDLDLYLIPASSHVHTIDRTLTKPLATAIHEQRHCIILGPPGAGKTTSMQKLCWDFFREDSSSSPAHNLLSQFPFPLLVRLRDLPTEEDNRYTILTYLNRILPMQFAFDGAFSQAPADAEDLKNDAFRRFIDSLGPLIILDGFDEYPPIDGRFRLAKEIRQLAIGLTKAKIIVTCRTGEFPYKFEKTKVFEIAPLNHEQIRSFATKWISDQTQAERFLAELDQSPYAETAMKPLFLAHLCAIYERIGEIPKQPKFVYRKIVALLLEEWDQERSVKRVSKYSDFSSDQKIEFLSHMAFDLTTATGKSVFEERDLLHSYENIHINFPLPASERKDVIAEIESHTGLFLRSGVQKYEFMHKSIQEYLTAEYIVRLGSMPDIEDIQGLGAEMAIAVAISSNSARYLTLLTRQLRAVNSLPKAFLSSFIYRLTLEKPTLSDHETVIISLLELAARTLNNGRQLGNYLPRRQLNDHDMEMFDMTMSLIPEVRVQKILAKYFRRTPEWESVGESDKKLVTAQGAKEIGGITVIAPLRLL